MRRLDSCNHSTVVLFLPLVALLSSCNSDRPDYLIREIASEKEARIAENAAGPCDPPETFVWDDEDLSTEVQLRPDGNTSTPLVEDLQAASNSPIELVRRVEPMLSHRA
jgi:polysaccharide export outer membrane protein